MGEVQPKSQVQDDWLFGYAFIGKNADNAVKLNVLEADLPLFHYHANKTIAVVKDTADTPNQMLRAIA